jgi:hypothetical protein
MNGAGPRFRRRADGVFGDHAEELDSKATAACAEAPNWQPLQSIPVGLRANTVLDFVSQVKTALGGRRGRLGGESESLYRAGLVYPC